MNKCHDRKKMKDEEMEQQGITKNRYTGITGKRDDLNTVRLTYIELDEEINVRVRENNHQQLKIGIQDKMTNCKIDTSNIRPLVIEYDRRPFSTQSKSDQINRRLTHVRLLLPPPL